MKADWDDAPSYLRRKGFKQSARIWGIPVIISTCIALVLIQAGSSWLLKSTAQHLAPQPRPKSSPVAEISYSAPIPDQGKWDRAVEEQARRDASQAVIQAPTAPASTPPPKQTVFHDQNYVPRGPDNVVSLRTAPEPYQSHQAPQQGVRVTVVGETQSTKDRVCGPYKEGSIERRNCKFAVGLGHRDRN